MGAGANGYDPDNDDWGCGYHTYTTDTEGDFTWSSGWSAYAYAHGDEVNGSLNAVANAVANTSGGGNSAGASVSTTDDDEDMPGGFSAGPTTDHFGAWSGVFAANYAAAEAHVAAYSSSLAYAEADASAWCSMY